MDYLLASGRSKAQPCSEQMIFAMIIAHAFLIVMAEVIYFYDKCPMIGRTVLEVSNPRTGVAAVISDGEYVIYSSGVGDFPWMQLSGARRFNSVALQ